MIAVAVAALECLLLAASPVGVFFLGPLVGLALGGCVSRHPTFGFLWGGIAGGLIQGVLFVAFLEVSLSSSALAPGLETDVFLIVTNAFAGMVIGWVFMLICGICS